MRYIFLSLFLFSYNGLCQSFTEQYGIIETIAGAGKIGGKGINGWKRSYERKNPIKAELSRPHYAMADSLGNIFIADKDAHAIRRIDSKSGRITTVAGTNVAGDNGDGVAKRCKLFQPNGLFVMPNGSFYILDLGNHKIRKVSKSGQMTTIFKDSSNILYGRGLWVNEKEDTIIYCSGTEIRLWSKSEGIKVYADGFEELGNICMDKSGNLLVTDRDRGKVYRFNRATGSVDHIAGNGTKDDNRKINSALDVSLEGVRGIWCTPDNGLLLACHESHDIWYMNPDGTIVKFLDGAKDKHDGDGENYNSKGKKISETRSVSMDTFGNILICENDVGYLRIVRKKE